MCQERRERKSSTGFSNSTDTAFAEIVQHSRCRMKTEETLIYHKITEAMGLLQDNTYGHELVLLCLIIPCVHCLLMFYFYKKCKWLFWFCVHRHRLMRSIVRSTDRTVIDPYGLNAKSALRVVCSSDI